jgi:hypothetical protein
MSEEANAAKGWTDAKLRYAGLHLSELQDQARKGSGDDFERAHIDAFLFQLLGAQDAFLQEVNLHYQCGLPLDQAKLGNLRKCIEGKGGKSAEIEVLSSLLNAPTSWLHVAREMRRQCTHRRPISRTFLVGGESEGEVHLHDPRSGMPVDMDYGDLFKTWLKEMKGLLAELRQGAIAASDLGD